MASEDDKKYDTYDNLLKDDGSGEVKVWRIEDFEKVPVEDKYAGHFFDGDSYIVLYSYEIDEVKHYIIYFWQGRHSTLDERGTSAMLTVDLDENMGGSPVQVRVVQGREPPHFRAVFAGRMIVHAGGKASGFRNRDDEDEIDDDGVRLYHVKGTSPTDTFASYVTEEASSLNSQDCFILCKDKLDGENGGVYLWEGSCSLPAERDVAASIAAILAEDKVSVTQTTEGEEPSEFWDAIGGTGDYPKQRPEDPQPSEPRLFQCSDALGEMSVNEISPFTQDDLNNSDVMILDCGTSIYVWVGSDSNDDEKKEATDIGIKYAAERSEESDNKDVPVAAVRAGSEPPFFTQHFVGWDPRFLEQRGFVDPLLAKEEEERQQEEQEAAAAAAEDDKALPEPTPKEEGDDPTKMEATLTDEEFAETFGMDRDAFYELKQWKQDQLKKSAGLF